jgi:hypothetical protein
MMIKNKIIAAVLSAAVLSAGSAFAIELEPKFYAGAEVLGSKLKAKDENISLKTRSGAALFAGSRLNENLGLELGFGYLGKTQNVKNTNLSADILGYLPGSRPSFLQGLQWHPLRQRQDHFKQSGSSLWFGCPTQSERYHCSCYGPFPRRKRLRQKRHFPGRRCILPIVNVQHNLKPQGCHPPVSRRPAKQIRGIQDMVYYIYISFCFAGSAA